MVYRGHPEYNRRGKWEHDCHYEWRLCHPKKRGLIKPARANWGWAMEFFHKKTARKMYRSAFKRDTQSLIEMELN